MGGIAVQEITLTYPTNIISILGGADHKSSTTLNVYVESIGKTNKIATGVIDQQICVTFLMKSIIAFPIFIMLECDDGNLEILDTIITPLNIPDWNMYQNAFDSNISRFHELMLS